MLFYSAETNQAGLRGHVNLEVKADAFYNYVCGFYTFEKPVLGGRFQMGAAVPVGYVHMKAGVDTTLGSRDVSATNTKLGDSLIAPALYWNTGNFHFKFVVDTGYLLSQFGARKKAARSAYHRFVGEGMAMGKVPELTGGGLIRSKGGWSQVVSARRSGQREESDERILGGGDFVNAILKEAEEKTRRQLKFRRADKTLNKIIEEECKKGRTSGNELRGGSRRRKVSMVRARIAKRGVDELGISMAEIARHVGMTTSSIAKAVARLEEEG